MDARMPPGQDDHEALRTLVAEKLGLEPSDIVPQTCARNTPEWDSLAHMMILDAVEKTFRIKLPRLAAYKAKDFGELAAIVSTERSRVG